MTNYLFWFDWYTFFGLILARYLLIAGVMHVLFYSALGKALTKREARLQPPRWKAIRKDIELSVLSAAVFALCTVFVLSEYSAGRTRLYTSVSEYGLWYLGVSFVMVLILQDSCYYFIHRAFHHPWVFKWLHLGHHRSVEPTAWTSFAFDPLEALVQALFLVGVVFFIPLHFITLVAVLITMTIWAVLNHLGFELFSSSFPLHWLGQWFIGPVHHLMHHRNHRVHYGLYFTHWDKLLGTVLLPKQERQMVR